MREQIIGLLLRQSFDEVVKIAAQEDITIHYNARSGDYSCKWMQPTGSGTVYETTVEHPNIKQSVVRAIVAKLEKEATNDPK